MTPQQWLEKVVWEWKNQRIREAFLRLAESCTDEILEDVFEGDMNVDGYFEEKGI